MRRVSITETAKHFCAWKWNAIHFAIYVYLNANLTFGVLYAHHPQHRYKCDAISEAHGLKPSDTADTWKKRVCNFVSLSQCIKYECNLVSLMQNGITFMTTNESPFSWSIGCHWLRCQATRSFVMHEHRHTEEKNLYCTASTLRWYTFFHASLFHSFSEVKFMGNAMSTRCWEKEKNDYERFTS